MKKTKFSKSVFLFALMLCLLATSAHALPSVAKVGDEIREQEPLQTEADTDKAFFVEAEAVLPSYMPGEENGALLFDENGKTIYDVLADGLGKFASEINVEKFRLSVDEFSLIYINTIYMNPSLYFVSTGYSFYSDRSSNFISKIIPIYLIDDKDEIKAEQQKLKARINEIVSLTNKSMTPVQKLFTVYDEVIVSCHYDSEQIKRTAKDLLVDGEAVCAGYASAFYALATELGIPCGFVHSKALNHVWNAVKLEGVWYHVDMTWDDDTRENSFRATHEWFLKSNEWITSEDRGGRKKYGFEWLDNDCDICDGDKNACPDSHTCPCVKYDDYFWNNAVSRIISLDNYLYYINDSELYGSITCIDTASGTSKKIHTFDSLWRENEQYIWVGAFSGLELFGERLYFNTSDKIYSCRPDGSDVNLIYTLSDSQSSIYGCGFDEGVLCFVYGKKEYPYLADEKVFVNIKGDINLDGVLDEKDAILLFRHSVFPHIYPTEYAGSMDFDKNGCLDIADVKALLEYIEERKQ